MAAATTAPNPSATDAPNMAINHAATAMNAAAAVAVASLGAIPQLGFIHEDSGQAFVLDIADLYRHDITLEIAFGAVKESMTGAQPLERIVRQRAAKFFRQKSVIPSMIDRIKTLLHLDTERVTEEKKSGAEEMAD
jgi:CRISP-associated protein Cas1